MSDISGSGMGRDNDLVLPPNTFAFVLDSTKGKVSVYVGPYKNSLSNTDQLVIWDERLSRFVPVSDPERAIQTNTMASEGQYMVLSNPIPGSGTQHPPSGNSTEAASLDTGRKVNVPGPVTFPLWPGQTAATIDGHHLRHNQYLLVRVYDPVQAMQNWDRRVIAPQVAILAGAATESEDANGNGESGDPAGETPSVPTEPTETPTLLTDTGSQEPPSFTMGQLMTVKGTEVSFYIPPTGIEVVPDTHGDLVRDAVTLETLEYCILLDENGQKRYLQGPDVVFPLPTEQFLPGDNGYKHKAIELTEHSGLYIKVIQAYEEGARSYAVGEELFITGAETAIYFPRPEHSIIRYGDKFVHYAIALPAGEGRYVLNRTTGTVDLVTGPRMFLPDPRTQVVVLRVLETAAINLLFPGNVEAVSVNEHYREMTGQLQDGDHLSSQSVAGLTRSRRGFRGDYDEEFSGDTIARGTTHTPPRSIVLDTKYDGAVAVNIWPGYAVLVTNKTGRRRVEVGPKMVLLEYDESIMPLELSTGKPKSDTNLLRTAYLRVYNNQVSDMVTVETRDLVGIRVSISYRANFEGSSPEEQQKWFDVENYVKVLTDHCRSRLRNVAKQHGITEFYARASDIIREALLGVKEGEERRPGLFFEENGMRVYDVEVLDVSIQDAEVGDLLQEAQSATLQGSIELNLAEEAATRTSRLQELERNKLSEVDKTDNAKAAIKKAQIGRTLGENLAKVDADLRVAVEQRKVATEALSAEKEATEQEIELQRQQDELELARLDKEVEQFVKRVAAVDGELAEAIRAVGTQQFVENITKAVGPAAVAAGTTTADLMAQIFKGTPFENAFATLSERPLSATNGERARV